MNFVVLDVETANPSLASICQVGIAVFVDGRLSDGYVSLVDPQDYFSGMNVAVHGIDEDDVENAPTFPDLHEDLARLLSGRIVVSHGAFDRNAMAQAAARFGLPPIACRWLDSARVARRTWSDCARRGYGLKALAERLGISFVHHDAYEDARAAGEVLLRAVADSGTGVEEWLSRSVQALAGPTPVTRDGNPDGLLYGECLVFTGALTVPRHRAADAAARMGCAVANSVTKKTSILVVGDQDIVRLRPNGSKSAKHLKAETMIVEGFPIRIIGESDFMALCELDTV